MLQLIGNTALKRRAQQKLQSKLETSLGTQGHHTIGYPGGNSSHPVFSKGDGSLYYAYSAPRSDSKIPRYWNSFGVFRPASTQEIVVEINIPVDRNDGRVAGFFATDPINARTFLMHDGGVGGGRPGIGKSSFLNFIPDQLVPVLSEDSVRMGLPIADLDDPNLPGLIWRFVEQVQAFKTAAAGGNLGSADSADAEAFNHNYSPEFAGRKQGARSDQVDYFTYHGMVVDALRSAREKSLKPGEALGKSGLIDLYVARGDQYLEIYEVKTSRDRQSLYTAVGQLVIHGQGCPGRILVLPEGEALPQDCERALKQEAIDLRHYRIAGQGVNARIEMLPS